MKHSWTKDFRLRSFASKPYFRRDFASSEVPRRSVNHGLSLTSVFILQKESRCGDFPLHKEKHSTSVWRSRKFKHEHPAVTFVAIDTFQLIRTPTADVSYGNDYAELQPLRALAEELKICLLLVHHLRKMGDKDPINKLSGSTGIAGAVDAIYVLEKNERIENSATLYASGRDIRDRKMKLEMKATLLFNGSNTDLASALSATLGREITAKGMKQMMNRWRFQMEALGVYFESRRSNGQKYIRVKYVSLQPTESASSDPSASTSSALISFVPCDPCVPA